MEKHYLSFTEDKKKREKIEINLKEYLKFSKKNKNILATLDPEK